MEFDAIRPQPIKSEPDIIFRLFFFCKTKKNHLRMTLLQKNLFFVPKLPKTGRANKCYKARFFKKSFCGPNSVEKRCRPQKTASWWSSNPPDDLAEFSLGQEIVLLLWRYRVIFYPLFFIQKTLLHDYLIFSSRSSKNIKT